ncbi:MAG: phosphoribosyltransferase family protein [Legionella sp.]|uniref:phosphoribosyltransferase n=1 Tax=Legionella sp. TaxID=459 RepID=UPI002849135C|nr:phosphoribosyltransferase family protein [Legionella sp.]
MKEQVILTQLAEIQKKLDAITEFKKTLEPRFWDNSEVCEDVNGVPLSKENIQKAVEQLADQLIEKHSDAFPILVGLMDGAHPFFAALYTELTERNYRFQYSTMQTTSYEGMQSGSLRFTEPKGILTNRLVIVVDDVCDTGKTADAIKKHFEDVECAKQVQLMVLVDKKQKRDIDPDFVGFTVSKDAFIIGYGLDFDGLVRNTDCIKTMNKAMLPTKQESEFLEEEKQLSTQFKALHKQLKALRENNKASSSTASQPGFFAPTDAPPTPGIGQTTLSV